MVLYMIKGEDMKNYTNNKGFTLIELLAVIVILAIIMLIATPMVMNTIEDAKKGAFKNTAYGLIEAATLEHAKHISELKGKSITYVYIDGVQSSNPIGYKLDYKGSKPKSGFIMIDHKGQVAIAIYDGK